MARSGVELASRSCQRCIDLWLRVREAFGAAQVACAHGSPHPRSTSRRATSGISPSPTGPAEVSAPGAGVARPMRRSHQATLASRMSGPVGFVGRQRELGLLEETLARARAGDPQVVYDRSGLGVWKIDPAGSVCGLDHRHPVLEVCADEDETLLSFGIIDQLPLGHPTDSATDPMTVGAGLVDLLDRLQRAVSSWFWSSTISSGSTDRLRAVLFALRRLRAEAVLTVVATRPEGLGDYGWASFV